LGGALLSNDKGGQLADRWRRSTKTTIFQRISGCRSGSLMYNSNFPHVPFGTFCND
jgi:hypothetical protein